MNNLCKDKQKELREAEALVVKFGRESAEFNKKNSELKIHEKALEQNLMGMAKTNEGLKEQIKEIDGIYNKHKLMRDCNHVWNDEHNIYCKNCGMKKPKQLKKAEQIIEEIIQFIKHHKNAETNSISKILEGE